MQPGSSHGPITLDGSLGHVQNLGDFFCAEAAEEAQFDDPGLPFAQALQPFQRGFKIEDIDGVLLQ